MESRRNIITLVIFVWRVLVVAASQRCNVDLCIAPDMANSSGLYDLQLSSQEYSTTVNGKMQISGKLECQVVYMGACMFSYMDAYITKYPINYFLKTCSASENDYIPKSSISWT